MTAPDAEGGDEDGAAAETAYTPATTRCATGAAIVEICGEGRLCSVYETCLSICANGACVGSNLHGIVAREGCGVGRRHINWGGSARITLTAP